MWRRQYLFVEPEQVSRLDVPAELGARRHEGILAHLLQMGCILQESGNGMTDRLGLN